jgi:hypothetical protein
LVDNQRTRWFDIEQGVRQGDSMSPILFAVFIDELVKELRATGLGVRLGETKLQALLFADDVALLAASPEELQQLIDVVVRYLRRWRLQENLKKSKVMVVAAVKEVAPQAEWRFGGQLIEQVKHYKYLGVWISQRRSELGLPPPRRPKIGVASWRRCWQTSEFLSKHASRRGRRLCCPS